ncbi:hypothetical protein ACFE33_04585 [Falsihalocynthiibacter sp. SS001]|uniref:hypothetical protein n=1 Tax=Falsihalocynthiibacter sp. SS001 TaxID=3349698 RepID=UPI0036D40536
MKIVSTLTIVLLLTACGPGDSVVVSEYEKTQDFDAIAKESVQGIDTTGFDKL